LVNIAAGGLREDKKEAGLAYMTDGCAIGA
jgi:hypothetical protein